MNVDVLPQGVLLQEVVVLVIRNLIWLELCCGWRSINFDLVSQATLNILRGAQHVVVLAVCGLSQLTKFDNSYGHLVILRR